MQARVSPKRSLLVLLLSDSRVHLHVSLNMRQLQHFRHLPFLADQKGTATTVSLVLTLSACSRMCPCCAVSLGHSV